MCVSTEGLTREGREVRRDTEKMVRFGTFNTRNVQNRGLESALCRMDQGGVDCGVFQAKNLTKEFTRRKLAAFR